MNDFVKIFTDRYVVERDHVDNCLFHLNNAIKAIQAGGLSKEQLQKICKDSLDNIEDATKCRTETYQAFKAWEEERVNEKRESEAYYHKHSRFTGGK